LLALHQTVADDLYHDYSFSYKVTADKICLVVTDRSEDKLAFVLNKDLDVIKTAYIDYSYYLIGANNSFLIFGTILELKNLL